MRINYIPVFYFGTRRKDNPQDKHYFLKKHLEFLQELEIDSPIEATLVFNVSSDMDEPEVNEIISHYEFKIPLETTFRENSGYSYAGWNHALTLNIHHNYDYSFLIEDDYIPSNKNFYLPFIEQVEDDTSFVCTRLSRSFQPLHAAMSSGLIYGKNVKKVFEAHNKVFDIIPGDGYFYAESSQVYFLSLFEALGLKLKELPEEFEKPFMEINTDIINYGGNIKAPIEPIKAE